MKPTIEQGFDYRRMAWAHLPHTLEPPPLAPEREPRGRAQSLRTDASSASTCAIAGAPPYLCPIARRKLMFDAAIKALAQMFSPRVPAGAAQVDRAGAAADRADRHRPQPGVLLDGDRPAPTWAEATAGGHAAWQVLAWVLSIVATLGIITGALFLMPAVTAFVGSFFVDEIADEVERTHYPNEPPGRALPLGRALIEGINTALLAVAGLSLRGAVPVRRGPRPGHHVPRQRLSSEPRIFSARRHALSPARGGQGDAPRLPRADFHRRAC